MAVEFADARHADYLGPSPMSQADADRSAEDGVIVIARDFSRYPGGRFRIDGPFSGEEFRQDVLIPALTEAKRNHGSVVVDLDGAAGYPSSFLEEAFGGLVREDSFTARELSKLLIVRAGSLFESYRLLALRYIREARPRAALA